MNKNYLINKLKKVELKSEKLYMYLKGFETNIYNEKLQTNINRICEIDDIISTLIIELECTEGDDFSGRR